MISLRATFVLIQYQAHEASGRDRRPRGTASLDARTTVGASFFVALSAQDAALSFRVESSSKFALIAERRHFPHIAGMSDERRSKKTPSADSGSLTDRRSKLQLKCVDDTTVDVTYEQAMMSSTLWALMQGQEVENVLIVVVYGEEESDG